MVSGFLLDVTSGTTLATLDPASGETNAERSEQRAGRNLGPWWPAGELNRPVQKAPTSGHPVEQDVKIVHFQQLSVTSHQASVTWTKGILHCAPRLFSSLRTSSACMGQIRAGRSPLFSSGVPEGPKYSPNLLPFCFTRGPHLPTAPRTRALRLDSEARGPGELGPPCFTGQHQASLLTASLSLRSLSHKIKKQSLSFAWLMLNSSKLKIFERQ